MKKSVILPSVIISLLLILSFSIIVKAGEDEFNPNYIISDPEMLNYDSMDRDAIQRFLEEKGSFLANYSCENAYGTKKTAAEIIYDASNRNYNCDGVNLSDDPTEIDRINKCKIVTTISPKFILVLLQKEMSLIEDSSPSQTQLDWAAGYGCPDGSSCSSRWKGFGRQVNSAALQFKHYLDNYYAYERGDVEFYQYTYKKGGSYVFTNPYASNESDQKDIKVTPFNQATAALYNYTPHVYNGNYNFYKLWNKYFTKKYPDGSLLQAEGEIGVWLIQDGQKRPFYSSGALKTRFDPSKIILVSKTVLSGYAKGKPIKFPNYSIIKDPSGGLYLLVDDTRRKFSDYDVFKKIGYNPEEIINASWQDVKSYQIGSPVSINSTYPTGALLQNTANGGIYWVYEGKKAPLLDKIFLETKFKNQPIIPTTPEELENYIKISPVQFENGELLTPENSPAVYLIANGKKRPFVSGNIFLELGYKWANIITVPSKITDFYPDGEAIKNQLN